MHYCLMDVSSVVVLMDSVIVYVLLNIVRKELFYKIRFYGDST